MVLVAATLLLLRSVFFDAFEITEEILRGFSSRCVVEAAAVECVLVIVYLFVSTLLRCPSFSLDHSPDSVGFYGDAKQKRGSVQNGDDVLLGGYPREISFTKHAIKLDTWFALIR